MDLRKQADILVTYLTRSTINDRVIYELYEQSVDRSSGHSEQKILSFAFSHPAFLPLLDAGLVFLRPSSELRRRIYIMFAILEAHPDYATLFLPNKYSIRDLVLLPLIGLRAVCRAAGGVILITMGRL